MAGSNNNNNNDDTNDKYLKLKAHPPVHAIATTLLLAATSLYFRPTLESIDEIATMETFATSKFLSQHTVFGGGEAVSLVLFSIRAVFAVLCWSVVFHDLFLGDFGFKAEIPYLPASKLRKGIKIPLGGVRSQFAYTSWCWLALGTSFALNAYITSFVCFSHPPPPPPPSQWILRAAIAAWEIAGPNTLLVSCVVKYALWPTALKLKNDSSVLRRNKALLKHNANVVMALSEAVLLGGLPVRFSHAGLVVFFGGVYIFFSWFMTHRWLSATTGEPAFLYFFLDTTLPGIFPSLAIVFLVSGLLYFFGLFVFMELLLESVIVSMGGWGFNEVVTRVGFVCLVCFGSCRFRD